MPFIFVCEFVKEENADVLIKKELTDFGLKMRLYT